MWVEYIAKYGQEPTHWFMPKAQWKILWDGFPTVTKEDLDNDEGVYFMGMEVVFVEAGKVLVGVCEENPQDARKQSNAHVS